MRNISFAGGLWLLCACSSNTISVGSDRPHLTLQGQDGTASEAAAGSAGHAGANEQVGTGMPDPIAPMQAPVPDASTDTPAMTGEPPANSGTMEPIGDGGSEPGTAAGGGGGEGGFGGEGSGGHPAGGEGGFGGEASGVNGGSGGEGSVGGDGGSGGDTATGDDGGSGGGPA